MLLRWGEVAGAAGEIGLRRAAKVDANQMEIIDGLRFLGASVQPLHTIGKGCPDLLVGWRQTNYLLEVKNPAMPPSKRKLTSDQVEWKHQWCGTVNIVESLNDALKVLGVQP